MQRRKTMTYTQKEKALLKRLAGFTAVYRQACQTFLETAAEKYPEAREKETGYWNVSVDDAILACVPDAWADVRDAFLHSYNPAYTDHHRDYMLNVLRPLYNETNHQFEVWWKQTYRTYGLDFNIPRPPSPLPKEIVKINMRTYRIGQLELRFTGDAQYRQMEVHAGEYLLDTISDNTNLRDLPKLMPTYYLPLMLPFLRLCDWSKLSEMSRPQQAALGKRYIATKRAQEKLAEKNKRADRHGIHLIIADRVMDQERKTA